MKHTPLPDGSRDIYVDIIKPGYLKKQRMMSTTLAGDLTYRGQ
jgi:hypothetical protein